MPTTTLSTYRCVDCDTRFLSPWLAPTDPALCPTCVQTEKALAAYVPPARVKLLALAS